MRSAVAASEVGFSQPRRQEAPRPLSVDTQPTSDWMNRVASTNTIQPDHALKMMATDQKVLTESAFAQAEIMSPDAVRESLLKAQTPDEINRLLANVAALDLDNAVAILTSFSDIGGKDAANAAPVALRALNTALSIRTSQLKEGDPVALSHDQRNAIEGVLNRQRTHWSEMDPTSRSELMNATRELITSNGEVGQQLAYATTRSTERALKSGDTVLMQSALELMRTGYSQNC